MLVHVGTIMCFSLVHYLPFVQENDLVKKMKDFQSRLMNGENNKSA